MAKQIGKTVDVLVEKESKHAGEMQGRTADYRIVHFKGQMRQVGQIMPVHITESYGQSLRGELILA
jgi:tRNA-2-methylthio-N6-dimethylallyladenosine synthase